MPAKVDIIPAVSTLRKLPVATAGEVSTVHAADPAGTDAGLGASERAAGAHMAAAHVHAAHAATMHPAAAHAAAMCVLRKGRAGNRQ